jgi:putative DNA primase/helicase
MTNPSVRPAADALLIARLAAMAEPEYDRVRKDEANKAGLRVSTLDGLVRKARDDTVQQAHKAARPIPTHDSIDATEDAIASAFAATNAGRIVYDYTAETWYIWRDSRWCRDTRDSVFNDARAFTRTERKKLTYEPKAMARIAFAAAVERAVRADPKLAVSHEVWDSDPWLLGTPDGVVNLRDGTLRPNHPNLYISRHTSVAAAPAGTAAPLWSEFLGSATKKDKNLQAFLHRFCGYLLTGIVTEEVLTFLYGAGGNGKGVLLSVLTGILGEYAVAVPIEVFTAGSRINLEYYRAQMAGVRLVTASETETQATWAESAIKEMTGNETPLSARHPFGRPFTYWPQFKIVLVGNYAPKLKGRSPAMERRLRVAPFNHTPQKPDPNLKEKLKAEYPAILRSMIDGRAAWQRERLGTADAIIAATSAYFEQQDALRRWIEERCVLDPNLSLKPGLLLSDFNTWAKVNGEEVFSGNSFAELIDRTPGLKRDKSGGVRLIRGIGLKAPKRPEPDDPEPPERGEY